MNEPTKASAIQLAHIFSEHAVLQREMAVPVWGWTRPRSRVRVTLGPYAAETRAGADGKFLARLPPMPAGGPYELDVRTPAADACVRVTDVMVGEVWVCSGQSNMEWTIRNVVFDPEDLSEADTLIRSLKVPNMASMGRQSDANVSWWVATPTTVPDFTAVGFFFARRLARELGVAVGLIDTSWGGTRIETWISREELVEHGWTRDEVARYEASVFTPAFWHRMDPQEPDSPEVAEQLLQTIYSCDPGNTGFKNGWADTVHDAGAWESAVLPGTFRANGHDTNGVIWFRREISIPAEWAGKELTLGLGSIDKQDISYFNGEQVGATGHGFEEEHWNVPRVYAVPGRLVTAGTAVIAVRVYSFVHEGGLAGPKEKMALGPVDGSAAPIALDGAWRMKIEHDFGLAQPMQLPFGPGNAQSPYMLNDNMIQPLIPYAIRGATWYQGESNADHGHAYGWMLRALIRDWRRTWGQGDFPFLTVQLANFQQPAPYDEASSWPWVREGQLASLCEPNTGLAVAIDIGDAVDIHPVNKQDVGARLAQWALARTYGRPIVPSGPLYRDHVLEGDRIRLRFDHVGGGLAARNGALQTFVIAGLNRAFLAAEAEIDGDTVVVHADAVPEPVAVRYAWADNPAGCNLYNQEGLPGSPFRTDAW